MARKLKGIREIREMPNMVREGYFATLTVEERLILINRFSLSDITLGLTQHDNHVSIHMLANPSKECISWFEESEYNG